MSPDSPILHLHEATLRFGERTLFKDLSFELMPRQMLGIAGESGSGKTSLLRAILGFVPLTAGEVKVCGLPLDTTHVDELRRLTAYVPQELQPIAAQGRDLVALTHNLRANHGSTGNLNATLEALGLDTDCLNQQASKLSGGQRQRILIAAALTLPKPLLLLDEPTSALDAETAQLVIAALRSTLQREQRAAVIVSHSSVLLAACNSTLTI